jgi:hypothetical protein
VRLTKSQIKQVRANHSGKHHCLACNRSAPCLVWLALEDLDEAQEKLEVAMSLLKERINSAFLPSK